MTEHKNHLKKSYQLESVADTQNFYTDWAATYDAEVMENGYVTPKRCADALVSFADRKSKILDIGCGTGLSGKILNETGFNNIDGCDINAEMLAVAKSRNIYQDLWRSNPEDPFPFDNGKYQVITAIGVIGAGAAPLSVYHETINKLTKDDLFVFSFNDHTLEDPSFEAAVQEQIDNKQFELLFKEYGEHLPGREIKSIVYVTKKI